MNMVGSNLIRIRSLIAPDFVMSHIKFMCHIAKLGAIKDQILIRLVGNRTMRDLTGRPRREVSILGNDNNRKTKRNMYYHSNTYT